MGNSSSDKNDNPSAENLLQTEDSLNELRHLLLGPLQTQLNRLQRRLDSPELRAKDTSLILPEAIFLRSTRDKKIEIALEPITEKAIKSSIKRDRKVLADALFPVMGPAIRRAIASAIQGMIQSLNQILENSLSIQGLKWRLEAARTKKPFAEVVLLHTLVYQVEQVFLIHKNTGLVLQHVVADMAVSQDPNLVSGMLTAIKDFVQDSFGGEKEGVLETLRVGERNVWVEDGPHAFLAAVIRGNPPMDLQAVLEDALEEIHFKQNHELAAFEGDATVFEEIRYILDNCLQARFKKEKQKPSYFLWIILIAILLILGAWSFSTYRDHRRWSNYVSALHSEPGLVITNVAKKDGKHHILGLRDPLAPDPVEKLAGSRIDPEQVVFHWEPYQSHLPQYVLRRIHHILIPPETIDFEVKNSSLHATGWAPHQWITETRKRVAALPGIEKYNDTEVIDIDAHLKPPPTVFLELKGRTLYAHGAAPHQWIKKTRNTITATGGGLNFNADHLTDIDLKQLHRIKIRIEQQAIYFKAGLNEMIPGQQEIVANLVKDITQLDTLTNIVDKRFHIEITGHCDTTGTEEKNLEISLGRAQAFLSILVAKGFEPEQFTVRGAGSKEPLREEINAQTREVNRRVTFKVMYLKR